jgi:hypothetical protein
MTTAKTENLTAYEFDGETGNQWVRELTVEELAQLKSDAAQTKAAKAEADAKVAARESALGKLAALGLTADEIGAL